MTVSVRVDTSELEKAFKQINRKMPAVTAKAINETARFAKSNSEKEVAKALRLKPLKLVTKRFTIEGEVKEDRTKLTEANRSRLRSTLSVYVRGIPVGQIAGKATKSQRKRPGVKAKAGRFYKGAFYNPRDNRMVFKRRKSGQLMMPKVGVRKLLTDKFGTYVSGRPGLVEFRKRWERLARFELSKISI